MYSHTTKRTIASAAFPGVSYTLRVISYAMRQRITERLRRILQERGLRESDVAAAEGLQAASLAAAFDRVYLEEALLGVHGLSIDGKLFDGEIEREGRSAIASLEESAPESLISEIARSIQAGMALDPGEEKNSVPPGIMSPEPTPGGMNAPHASAMGCGGHATAAATTPMS